MRQKKFNIPATLEVARKMYRSGDDELREKALEYFDEVELVTQESLISTFIHEARGDFALNVAEIDKQLIRELISLIQVGLYSEALYQLILSHDRSLRFANTFKEYYDHIDERVIRNKFKQTYED